MVQSRDRQSRPETDRHYRTALSHCFERVTNGEESDCSPSKQSVKFNKQRPKSGNQYEPYPERETNRDESGKKRSDIMEIAPNHNQLDKLDSLYEDIMHEENDSNIYTNQKLKMMKHNSEQPTPQTVNELT